MPPLALLGLLLAATQPSAGRGTTRGPAFCSQPGTVFSSIHGATRGPAFCSQPGTVFSCAGAEHPEVAVEQLAQGVCLVQVNRGSLEVREVGVNGGVTPERLEELAALGSLHIRRAGSRKFERLYAADGATGEVLSNKLQKGDLLRIHTDPVRFAACGGGGKLWLDRCCFVNENFVVVDKPAGLPCSPHVSNAAHVLHRCMLNELGRQLGGNADSRIDELIPLHRLDACTTGYPPSRYELHFPLSSFSPPCAAHTSFSRHAPTQQVWWLLHEIKQLHVPSASSRTRIAPPAAKMVVAGLSRVTSRSIEHVFLLLLLGLLLFYSCGVITWRRRREGRLSQLRRIRPSPPKGGRRICYK